MVEGGLKARGEVRDQAQAEHAGSQVARGDGLEDGRHAHQVRTQGVEHPDLRRRLERPAEQPCVHARGSTRIGCQGDLAEPGVVQRRHVGEAGAELRRGCGAHEGAGSREVELVGDHDRGPHRRRGAQGTGCVGQHHRSGPGEHCRAHRMGHGVGVVSLVEVGASREHEHAVARHLDHRCGAPVAGDGGLGDAAEIVHRHRPARVAQVGDDAGPTGAHHERDRWLAQPVPDRRGVVSGEFPGVGWLVHRSSLSPMSPVRWLARVAAPGSVHPGGR